MGGGCRCHCRPELSDALELVLQMLGMNSGPVEEQLLFLATGLSLQPFPVYIRLRIAFALAFVK